MSETNINNVKNQMAAVLAPATDEQLVQMIVVLANSKMREAKISLFAVYDECERRYPSIIETLEQWVGSDEDDRAYWEMMVEVMGQAA